MERILVLQLKRIGDLILTGPLTAALRARLPDAHITLLSRGPASALAPLLPGVDETLSQRPGRPQPGLWAKMLGGRFDTVLDLTGNDRSALYSFLSRAKRKATYERHCSSSRLRRRLYKSCSDASVRELHTVDYHLALLELLGLEPPVPAPDLQLRIPEDTNGLRARLREAAAGRPLAVVHPGTVEPNKYWVAERWGEVIDHLKGELGYAVALSCGPDPSEQRHADAVVAASGEGVDFREPTSLGELVILLDESDALLSVDTAVVHIAAALRKPQVSLFGPTNPFHWHPRHPGSRVVLAGTPGVAREFSPRHARRPMEEIAVADVLEALGEVVPRAGGSG